MRYFFAFIAVFALCSVRMTESVSAAPQEWESERADFSLLPDQPIFSLDTDVFLGQKKRRRGGGGRVWANLYYGDTTLKPKEEERREPQFYGFQLGFDVAKSRGVYSTFFFNVNQSKMDVAGAYPTIDHSKINNYLLGYGKFFYLSACHFVFTGSIAYDQHEVSRAGDRATGGGMQTNLFGEFGLDFILKKWGIKPFYALHYDFLYHGKIGEIGDWNGHGLQQLLGLRLNWKVTTMLELQGRTIWVHEMLDNPPPFYHCRFSPVQGINTPAIMFYQGNTGRDWAWLGVGAKLDGILGLYLFCDYDLLINERHVTHLGSLGFCLGW